MRLLANAAAGTADPHINYTLQYFQLNYILYDGLVTYKKAGDETGFEVVADLAEASRRSKTAARPISSSCARASSSPTARTSPAKDVVASFQRIFKISGPTAGTFYNGIVGADACLKTPATCTLEGGLVGRRRGRHDHLQPYPAGCRVPAEDRRPACVDPAGQRAAQGCRYRPDPGHRPLHDRQLRSQQADEDGAQSRTSRSGARKRSRPAIRTRSTMNSASPTKRR